MRLRFWRKPAAPSALELRDTWIEWMRLSGTREATITGYRQITDRFIRRWPELAMSEMTDDRESSMHGKQALLGWIVRLPVLAVQKVRKVKSVFPSHRLRRGPDEGCELHRPQDEREASGSSSLLPDTDSTGRPFGRLSDVKYQLKDAEGDELEIKRVHDARLPDGGEG